MKIYNELAKWWPLFAPAEEFTEEAAFFRDAFLNNGIKPADTLLELGSGTGNNASRLKSSFTLTLADISPQMLEMSKQQNPDCEHILGDMRTLRLGKSFDAVFIHDAVMYMTSEDDLHNAIETASLHCRKGGVTIFVPDFTNETFESGTNKGGTDGSDGRGIRYLIWDFDPNPSDTVYTEIFSIVLRDLDDSITFEHEESRCGLFPRGTWKELLSDAGFTVTIVTDSYGRDVFIGIKR